MSGEKKPPIIKKVIKKGHGGHHGGSWKVAYADFVTAMMAFFLVMWLLAISSEAGRQALADYFNELTMTDAIFNGGLPSAFTEGGSKKPSVLDGGCFQPKTDGDATIESEATSEAGRAQMAALLQTTQELLKNLESLPEGVEGGEGGGDAGRGDFSTAGMTPGQEEFAQTLHSEIQADLGAEAAGQVLVEKVKGGLRIQIVDREGRPMFTAGGPGLTQEARDILNVVSDRLKTIPNKISIEGHTDALRFSGQRMTNWELSTARASAVRLYLASRGLPDDRLTAVTGYAATQPLDKANPNDPINRRVSLMIWDEEPAAAPPPFKAPTNGQAPSATHPNGAVKPPPLPRPTTPRPPAVVPPTSEVPLSRDELERRLVDSVMEKSATPDLSTVGPPPATQQD